MSNWKEHDFKSLNISFSFHHQVWSLVDSNFIFSSNKVYVFCTMSRKASQSHRACNPINSLVVPSNRNIISFSILLSSPKKKPNKRPERRMNSHLQSMIITSLYLKPLLLKLRLSIFLIFSSFSLLICWACIVALNPPSPAKLPLNAVCCCCCGWANVAWGWAGAGWP